MPRAQDRVEARTDERAIAVLVDHGVVGLRIDNKELRPPCAVLDDRRRAREGPRAMLEIDIRDVGLMVDYLYEDHEYAGRSASRD